MPRQGKRAEANDTVPWRAIADLMTGREREKVTQESEAFTGWAILELMGHRRLAGYLTEQEVAGAAFIRIDVPGDEGTTATQFYAPAAVYCITPTTEEIARAVAKRDQPEPVSRWELPAPKEPESKYPMGLSTPGLFSQENRYGSTALAGSGEPIDDTEDEHDAEHDDDDEDIDSRF